MNLVVDLSLYVLFISGSSRSKSEVNYRSLGKCVVGCVEAKCFEVEFENNSGNYPETECQARETTYT